MKMKIGFNFALKERLLHVKLVYWGNHNIRPMELIRQQNQQKNL